MTGGAPPLYQAIYGVLRDHLVGGRLPEGLVLGETVVARAFGASRVPAAAALRRLHADGLITGFEGRGYLAGARRDVPPLRLDLAEAGLQLPPDLLARRRVRNRSERIYPEVEHTVAACLSYGRFLLNESALAEHTGTSRTVAHEVLTRLERAGLVSQDTNQRWYAGPLTADLLREHFEMRWLLEPIALGQAIEGVEPSAIEAARRRAAAAARAGYPPPAERERLEQDLHVDIVLRCRNRQLRDTIRRHQLPIIATHSTFADYPHDDEIATMVAEHVAILGHLAGGRTRQAQHALKAHLRRSLEPNIELLGRIRPLPESRRPPYLVPV